MFLFKIQQKINFDRVPAMNVSFEYFGNRNLQTSIKDFRYGSFET